jgi:hypothetical protein
MAPDPRWGRTGDPFPLRFQRKLPPRLAKVRPRLQEAGTGEADLEVGGLATGMYMAVVDLQDMDGHFVLKQVVPFGVLK